jgi:ABC-type phosphate/phosphonate transport system substrate-binding protein
VALLPVCVAAAATALAAVEPLRLAVTDPLARQNACTCVDGYGQRDYHALGRYLERRLQRSVAVTFPAVSAVVSGGANEGMPGLVIGSRYPVEAAFAAAGRRVMLLAVLSGPDGAATQPGLFVVRQADAVRSLLDLKDRRIVLGPTPVNERHAAALAALRRLGLPPVEPLAVAEADGAAVTAVLRGEADAAVISAHALPLLVGCDALRRDELRVVGRTEPVPFIAVFATESLPRALLVPIVAALDSVGEESALLRRLESRDGFAVLPQRRSAVAGWTDWRGSVRRDGLSTSVPSRLPAEARFAWRRALCGQSLGGIAATADVVVVSDKSADLLRDVWRCLDAGSGESRWTVEYAVPAKMDFTSAPRATSVITEDAVYLLSAFGDLLCVDPADGRVLWRVDLFERFGGELPTWGFCGTPLLVGDCLVAATASEKAGLVALDRRTGKQRWTSPGSLPGYGSLVAAELGGRRQVVGHDRKSLCGWDPATGRRWWRLVPAAEGDFNVPTPLAVSDLLLAATENNGARLFAFGEDGLPGPEPVAQNAEFAPDTVSPVLVDGRLWGFSDDVLRCLDIGEGLRQVWNWDAHEAGGHVSLIAGNGRVLVCTHSGEVWLCPARPEPETRPERLAVFATENGFSPEVWSHPALVGTRLYLRSRNEVVCLLLE